MPTDDDDLMNILDEHLAVKDESGRVVLQGALLATVYFEKQYARSVRESVVTCCEEYFRRWGDKLRWALNPDTEVMEPFGKGRSGDPRPWLPDLGEEEAFSLIYHGAEDDRGAGAFSLEAFGARRYPYPQLGYLRVSFPLLWFAERSESLQDVLLDISRKLQPVSGYGGIGIIESPSSEISSRYEPVVYYWAQRFPGLEADYPIAHGISLAGRRSLNGPGIKGGNWLTVLGDQYAAELGGADKIEADLAALDQRFLIRRYESGLLIQAGPRPQLGDAERGRWPDLYVKLAQILKPIQVTNHCPFQYGGPGERFDHERSVAWLRRFDDR